MKPGESCHLQPDAVCTWLMRHRLSSKGSYLWEVEVVGLFSTFENSSGERKDKAIWTYISLVYRNLFFHQTTKPLALVSSAASHGLICGQETSACLVEMARPSKATRSGFRERWGLGKAVFILAACIFTPPAKDSSRLSTCNVATLPSLLSVLLGKTGIRNRTGTVFLEYSSCLSSGLVWFSHMPWRISQESVNILPFVLLHFKVFKKQTDKLISMNKLLGWHE